VGRWRLGRGRPARRADPAARRLDLALEQWDLSQFLRAIGVAGFPLLRGDGPFNKMLVDEPGRKVD
jgi:hypothetical protein